MNPTEILRQPYGRIVVPDSDGTYRAEIVEFSGCIATGDTATEALANLEDTAWDWLEAAIERGQHIPKPLEVVQYSGKLVVRLPKSLHKKAAYQAARDGVSLNQFILASIAEQVGAKATSNAGITQSTVYVAIVQHAQTVGMPMGQGVAGLGEQGSCNLPNTLLKTEYEHARG